MSTPELHFTKKDFKLEWFNGTGPGGQNKNKRAMCCRITHTATGMTCTGQEHRDRPSNQRVAFTRLAKRLIAHYTIKEDMAAYRSTERVRTYHEPRNDVLDHASGVRKTYKEIVIDGNIEELVEARRRALVTVV